MPRNPVVLRLLAAILVLVAAPAPSLACSCGWDGIETIGHALHAADAIVIGKVVYNPQLKTYAGSAASVRVDSIESLKGGISGTFWIDDSDTCPRSFDAGDLEVGKVYVFPLQLVRPPGADDRAGSSALPGRPNPGGNPVYYRLRACSQSALLLDGSSLYNGEHAGGGQARLRYYLPLPVMRAFIATGIIGFWTFEVPIALVLTAVIVFLLRRHRATVPFSIRARHVAIALTWLTLAGLAYGLFRLSTLSAGKFPAVALCVFLLPGLVLIAHHVKPVHPALSWSALVLSALVGALGLVIYVSGVWRERSLLVEESTTIALFTVPVAVASVYSLVSRRREWKQRRAAPA